VVMALGNWDSNQDRNPRIPCNAVLERIGWFVSQLALELELGSISSLGMCLCRLGRGCILCSCRGMYGCGVNAEAVRVMPMVARQNIMATRRLCLFGRFMFMDTDAFELDDDSIPMPLPWVRAVSHSSAEPSTCVFRNLILWNVTQSFPTPPRNDVSNHETRVCFDASGREM
jgi:hypothetical protein